MDTVSKSAKQHLDLGAALQVLTQLADQASRATVRPSVTANGHAPAFAPAAFVTSFSLLDGLSTVGEPGSEQGAQCWLRHNTKGIHQ